MTTRSRAFILVLVTIFLVVLAALLWKFNASKGEFLETVPKPVWEIRSVDTMKYSRDLALARLEDEEFDAVIELQMGKIAESGATHVAIGTPYDAKFVPFLKRWVVSARRNQLRVWFRGNFSGWEGWFSYERISPEEHKKLLREFIENNPDLFESGDLFTSCTECENGNLGDPRKTGKVSEFRQFLIDENNLSQVSFRKIGRNVRSNFFPMNGDVARLVMDKKTTNELGGIVVIDHYVQSPERLSRDVEEIARLSGGRIVLGEIGAPIPDIHGSMSSDEQEKWLSAAFLGLSKSREVLGVNYWVGFGGTTAIWSRDGQPKKAAEVLQKYYKSTR